MWNSLEVREGCFVEVFFIGEPIHIFNQRPGFKRCGVMGICVIESPAKLKDLMLENGADFIRDDNHLIHFRDYTSFKTDATFRTRTAFMPLNAPATCIELIL